jgi:hypothetical protein
MKLSSEARRQMSLSEFGLPGSRKYPMPDKSHAANAKARATQMHNRGQLSLSSMRKIKAKANRVMDRDADGE